MLSNSEIEYLIAIDNEPVVRVSRDGVKYIRGGDDQYSALLSSPNLATYRSFVKDKLTIETDQLIERKHERLSNPRYQAKHQEALIYKSSGYTGSSTDFNFLAQEALERGLTMTQVADLIINAVNNQNDKIAKIEKRRINAGNLLDAATTINDIYTIHYAAIAAIEAI